MRKSDVVAHFGSQSRVARALNITRSAVNRWPDVIPEGVAYKLQVVTAGHLRVDPLLYLPKSPGA
jgi:hypothetical protein